jgi:hypothetical protein
VVEGPDRTKWAVRETFRASGRKHPSLTRCRRRRGCIMRHAEKQIACMAKHLRHFNEPCDTSLIVIQMAAPNRSSTRNYRGSALSRAIRESAVTAQGAKVAETADAPDSRDNCCCVWCQACSFGVRIAASMADDSNRCVSGIGLVTKHHAGPKPVSCFDHRHLVGGGGWWWDRGVGGGPVLGKWACVEPTVIDGVPRYRE